MLAANIRCRGKAYARQSWEAHSATPTHLAVQMAQVHQPDEQVQMKLRSQPGTELAAVHAGTPQWRLAFERAAVHAEASSSEQM